jgi:hypothetical protein
MFTRISPTSAVASCIQNPLGVVVRPDRHRGRAGYRPGRARRYNRSASVCGAVVSRCPWCTLISVPRGRLALPWRRKQAPRVNFLPSRHIGGAFVPCLLRAGENVMAVERLASVGTPHRCLKAACMKLTTGCKESLAFFRAPHA